MIKFEQEVRDAIEKRSAADFAEYKKRLVSENKRIYLIGRNEQSLEITKRYKVEGLIDDFIQSYETWNGFPIVKTKDIETSSLIINCVTSISPVEVKNHLKSVGLSNVLKISDLISEDSNPLSLPWFVVQQRDEMRLHQSWWNELFARMSDDLSRKTLLDVVRFRLTADLDYMN